MMENVPIVASVPVSTLWDWACRASDCGAEYLSRMISDMAQKAVRETQEKAA